MRTEIAYHVLRSQSNRSGKLAREILDQKRMIPIAKFANTRRTTWSKSIVKIKGGIFQQDDGESGLVQGEGQDGERLDTSEEHGVDEGEEVPWLTCDKCGNGVKSTRKAFKLSTLGAKTWCGRCKKSLMAKEWK